MKHVLALAAVAVIAFGCASNETKSTASSQAAIATPAAIAPAAAPSRPACKPPPGELVVNDLEPGSGETARFRTAVLVSYKGWLYDGCAPDFKGALFDESTTVPLSVMVGVGRVIKGWDEGLIGLKEGGKRRLIIPSEKAYGAQGGPGGRIPPNAPLVFEVTLVKVIAQAPQ